VIFRALTLFVGRKEGNLAHKRSVPLITKGSLLGQVKNRGRSADQASPGKWSIVNMEKGMEKTKPNTTKAHSHQSKEMYYNTK